VGEITLDIAQECSIGTPFVTSVVVDPDDPSCVWAGVEIDGVFRSLDGGDTWTHLETGLYDPDIHAVTIAATQRKRIYASTAREMLSAMIWATPGSPWVSRRNGRCPTPVGSWSRPMILACCSPGVERPRRGKGHVLRTTDFGDTWEVLPLPTQPNATVWGLATHPANANRIVAFSLFGEVYVTEDGGASWRKIAREFGEIRAAVWVPN
jgi:photosystem II stability/assembly factor-like uncharacterized protein